MNNAQKNRPLTRLSPNELMAAARGSVIRVTYYGVPYLGPDAVIPVPDSRLIWVALSTWRGGTAYRLCRAQRLVAASLAAADAVRQAFDFSDVADAAVSKVDKEPYCDFFDDVDDIPF